MKLLGSTKSDIAFSDIKNVLHLDITEDNKIGNKICNQMIKVPRDSPENNSETVISEIDNTGIDRE